MGALYVIFLFMKYITPYPLKNLWIFKGELATNSPLKFVEFGGGKREW